MDFADIERFGWEDAMYLFDDVGQYDEDRELAIGFLDLRLIVIVFTIRGDARRIISMRKAEKHEERLHRYV